MQRPGLLKGLLDVVRRFVPEAERHAVDQRPHLGRIFQAAGEVGAHPVARPGGCAHDRVAAADAQDRPILRITNEDALEDILPREVGAQVEDARVARRRDGLGDPGKPNLIAQPRTRFPARPDCRPARLGAAIDFDRVEPEEEGRVVAGRKRRLARDRPVDRDHAGPVAKARAELAPGRVVHLRLVEREIESADEKMRQPPARPEQTNDRSKRDQRPENDQPAIPGTRPGECRRRRKARPRERLTAGNCGVHRRAFR